MSDPVVDPVAVSANYWTEDGEISTPWYLTAELGEGELPIIPGPVHTLSADTATVLEGGVLVVSVSTAFHDPETLTLPYIITGIASADISVPLQGNFNLDAQGSGSISITVSSDLLTEGSEVMRFALADSTADPLSIVIVDSSTTPIPDPIYTLTADKTQMDEGESVTFTLAVQHPASGVSSYPYLLTGVSQGDTSTPLSGNLVLDFANQATLVVQIDADEITEGDETLVMTLVGITPDVTKSVLVKDTSLTPPPPVPKRYFSRLQKNSGEYYHVNGSMSFPGDFKISWKFRLDTPYHEIMFGDDHKKTYYVNAQSNNISVYIAGAQHIFPVGPTMNDGRLHKAVLSLVGNALTLNLDGVDLGTKQVVPYRGLNNFRFGHSVSVMVYTRAILADFVFESQGTIIHEFKLDGGPTLSHEADSVGAYSAARINIPANQVEEFTKTGRIWSNADGSVTIAEAFPEEG